MAHKLLDPLEHGKCVVRVPCVSTVHWRKVSFPQVIEAAPRPASAEAPYAQIMPVLHEMNDSFWSVAELLAAVHCGRCPQRAVRLETHAQRSVPCRRRCGRRECPPLGPKDENVHAVSHLHYATPNRRQRQRVIPRPPEPVKQKRGLVWVHHLIEEQISNPSYLGRQRHRVRTRAVKHPWKAAPIADTRCE
eukprot:6180061-Pleurochrysis_carterae.AAC.3